MYPTKDFFRNSISDLTKPVNFIKSSKSVFNTFLKRSKKVSNSLKLNVYARKNGEYYEGTVTFTATNLGTAKVQKADGTTRFSTYSAVVQSAKAAARKLNCNIVEETQVKKAAKKTTKKPSTPTVTNPTWLNS
jgi:hypothetical protein